MKFKQSLIIIFIFFTIDLIASKTVVKGNAILFKGKEITIYTYDDYLNNLKVKVGYTTIKENGEYSFELNADKIKKVFLKIEDKTTWFFVKPGEIYNINLSYDESFNKGRIYDKELSLIFSFPVPSELNQQVKKFNESFDQFIDDNTILLSVETG